MRNPKSFFDCLDEGNFYNTEIKDEVIDIPIDRVTFDTAYFKNVDFTLTDISHVDIVDTVFENCDFSNLTIEDRWMSRVHFINCKLTGLNLKSMSLHDVLIDNSHCKYLSIVLSNVKDNHYRNCDMSDSVFYNNEIKKLELTNTNFINAEFSETKLKDTNFASCIIAGSHFDPLSLKGIIIDPLQSEYLVGMLGVKFTK